MPHSRHHHHHHRQQQQQQQQRVRQQQKQECQVDAPPMDTEIKARDGYIHNSPYKHTKLKRHKRSKTSRDIVEPVTTDNSLKPPKVDPTTSSMPAVPSNPSEQLNLRLTGLFDTDLLDHFEDGDDLHSKDLPVNQHPNDANGTEVATGDRDLGAANQYSDHSHLLLELDENEFEDVLSRSLFSQCHDSNNPESPFVDMFGDEDQMQSDASMHSSGDGTGSNSVVCARRIKPQSTLFDSDDGDDDVGSIADKKSTRPAAISGPRNSVESVAANRVATKTTNSKTESCIVPQTNPEQPIGKNSESNVNSNSKDRLKDEVESRGKSSGTVSFIILSLSHPCIPYLSFVIRLR